PPPRPWPRPRARTPTPVPVPVPVPPLRARAPDSVSSWFRLLKIVVSASLHPLARAGGLGRDAGHHGDASVLDDVEHQADTGHVGDKVAAPVAKEGQGDTGDWNET